jgi:hypothetical protein
MTGLMAFPAKTDDNKSLMPFILYSVPGDGGSQLWHKYDSDKYYTSVWMYPYKLVFHTDTLLKQLT